MDLAEWCRRDQKIACIIGDKTYSRMSVEAISNLFA
jgi:hypothetical protein